MDGAKPPEIPSNYGQALAAVGAASLAALRALEAVLRRLHPPGLPQLREHLAPVRDRLADALDAYRSAVVPAGLEPFHEQLAAGSGEALAAAEHFLASAPPPQVAASVLASMRGHCRAQELFYPLRGAFPPLAQYFVEPAFHERLAELDPEPSEGASVGLHRTGSGSDGDARGGFSLYVPERYRRDATWPLVVALHGGHGHGRDFLWTWLREARGRGFLLLAPTSRGTTWAFDNPGVEAAALRSMVDSVCEQWSVDRGHILLTGLSDGATFALLAGLAEDAPFTALAPVSGVLHPDNFRNGNLGRAKGKRIYLVHGALDWMFPVSLARGARDALEQAQADLTYREIADLSHAYPREENDRILTWFDPGLALPGVR